MQKIGRRVELIFGIGGSDSHTFAVRLFQPLDRSDAARPLRGCVASIGLNELVRRRLLLSAMGDLVDLWYAP